jgi:Type II CAAX prenyl endopeptidase Rce1-like
MATVAPAAETLAEVSARDLKHWLTAAEILAFYGCILADIWRWQYSHPLVWVVFLAALVASHWVHGDSLRDLGLTGFQLRASAETVLPIMTALYAAAAIFGFASGRFKWVLPNRAALVYFLAYGSWCLAQQYLAQSYFHHRLMTIIRNRHLSSLLVAVMFGSAHIPNPILMIATTIAGFIFAETFARHRNIWPLALAQAVGGFLMAALTPAALIHNMRVGPGYFFWGLR